LGTFELDGNATTGVLGTSGSTNTSHDWDQVFADAGSPSGSGSFSRGPASGAIGGSFLSDETTGDDIFTGGSTKDTLPVGGWLFKTGKPQDKDELLHAYAAEYIDPGNGHQILYSGLDRFSNSGDSTAGFWFFGGTVAKSTNGTVGGSGAPFTGVHHDGDILLISDFTVGGSVATIAVYRWTGNDATGSLVNVTAMGNPNTFAIVNSAPVSVPWSYTDKGGFTQPQAGEFLEEGVDLTALGIQGCFTSFLAESRSSQSTTATLSDFVTGGIPICSLAAPQFTGLSKFDTFTHQGDTVTYPLTVQNTGGSPLFIQSVSDTLLGNIVVNHTLQSPVSPVTSITSAFNFNTALAPGASLTIFVSRPVQVTDPDPTNDTVTFVGTDDLAGLADPISTSVSNSVNLFQPSVTMTETASAAAAVAGTPITYTYTINNTSSSDSPNLVLNSANQGPGEPDTFTSSLFGDIEADAVHAMAGNNTATTASLAPGASFSFTETHVLSATDPTPLTDTSSAIFTLAQNLGAFPNQIHSNITTATVRRVDAEISIAGSGVNEINNPHTFTVTVNQDLGDGNGFVPAANEPVTVTLTNTNGSTTSPTTFNVTTNASGQASVTFTSATAGEVVGNASTTFSVEGVTLTRATGDIHAGDSGPVTKFFEDANISIAPNATNAVGQPHTFTVTVLDNAGDGNGYVPAANEPVTVTLTSTNGANAVPSTPLSGTTNASGQFQVTFTSATAGQVIGNASTTFTLNGVTLTRATGDSRTGDSGPATKTFVDERISIAPNATNAVGQPHTFTVTVLENVGDNNGFVVPVSGQAVTVTLTSTNGANAVPSTPLSGNTSASGQFQVTFTSATAGQVIGNATTSFTVNNATETRSTGDSQSGDSGPATKTFVDEQIRIAGSGVNEVNNPHTFTATVLENLGDGNGFVVPVSGQVVTITLTNTNGSTTSPTTFMVTTNASGQASATFTSATAGTVIGNASTSFTVNNVTETRSTGDAQSGDSGPVTKVFEDATISIAPNATNGITEPHTFTVTVLDNAGDGNSFVAAAGVSVTVTLTGTSGAVPIAETPLSGTTNASGQFQVTFTSDSAGQVLGNASTSFTLNGVTLTRATGDSHTGDSGPATKTFVAGKILWKKVDQNGNLLGGATFLVTATGGRAAGLSPTSVSVLDNGSFDANPANGLLELDAFQSFGGSNLTGLALGTYTVQEITPPAGYTLDPRVLTVTLTQSSLTGDLTGTPFVDTLPTLTINKAVTSGFATVIHPGDTASYTITVSNTGAGTAQNVVVSDQLPDASALTWTASSSAFITSISGGVLTATDASLAGGASATVTVSAVVPLNFFGTPGTGTGNGDAVPLGLFELDGNTTTGVLGTSGSTTTSHDWDQVFADATNGTTTSGALATAFTTDETSGDDIFTGGSTKDTLPVSGWLFKTGKPQDKDEISHAYAAEYKDPATGDQILYAGLDRFSNSGNSTAGFWFFVNPVSKSVSGTVGGSGAPFTGTHHDGDLLLISNFTIGGSVSTIAVYKWVGSDATGSLVNVTAMGNPGTFAIVNSGPISVPWAFTDKANFNQPQAGEFLEEGVNLTGLGLNACFSSFLAETRSSQSTTATLSDFIIGPNFNTCNVTLPNVASVSASNFNNGQPITSNQVIITINDGMPLLAPSPGNAGGTNLLTQAELQSVAAQAIAGWRTAGIDAATLGNLENFTFRIGQLSAPELGYEVPGLIWIDQSAAGWGWDVNGGAMDLTTVVSHELGHALGFEHSETGVMQDVLPPGVQRLPEAIADPVVASAALSSDSTASVGSSSEVTPSSSSIGEATVTQVALAQVALAQVAQPGVAPFTMVRTGTIVTALAVPALFNTEAADAGVGSTTRGIAPAPVILPDRTDSVQHYVAAATVLPVATPQVPDLRPPSLRIDSWGVTTPTGGVGEPAGDMLAPSVPADALQLYWERVTDDTSAGAITAELADSAAFVRADAAPIAGLSAAVALGYALGGSWSAPLAEDSELRKRLRRLSNRI
jgi:uncharacterized repeat protein (TIGR01451 family)